MDRFWHNPKLACLRDASLKKPSSRLKVEAIRSLANILISVHANFYAIRSSRVESSSKLAYNSLSRLHILLDMPSFFQQSGSG